jgi:hypothetical protein
MLRLRLGIEDLARTTFAAPTPYCELAVSANSPQVGSDGYGAPVGPAFRRLRVGCWSWFLPMAVSQPSWHQRRAAASMRRWMSYGPRRLR